MMEESCHPCTYIPYISFGHHKQTNLPSANSSLDMLMPALKGCICVHGVYLPFPEFLNQLYVTRYMRRREVAPFATCLPASCRTGCRSRSGKDMNLPWMPILLQIGMTGLEPAAS